MPYHFGLDTHAFLGGLHLHSLPLLTSPIVAVPVFQVTYVSQLIWILIYQQPLKSINLGSVMALPVVKRMEKYAKHCIYSD